MAIKGWMVSMGVGLAAGAVAAVMLPRQSTARKLVGKAAGAVEDAAQQVAGKISQKMDM